MHKQKPYNIIHTPTLNLPRIARPMQRAQGRTTRDLTLAKPSLLHKIAPNRVHHQRPIGVKIEGSLPGEGILPWVGDVFQGWLDRVKDFLHADEDLLVVEHFLFAYRDDFYGKGELGGDGVGVAFEFRVAVGTGFLDVRSPFHSFWEGEGGRKKGTHEEGEARR